MNTIYDDGSNIPLVVPAELVNVPAELENITEEPVNIPE